MENIVEPDDREAAFSQAEDRIWVVVQKDEDKNTTNNIETLRSDVVKLSAEEVVCMKKRHQGSAASTVAAATGGSGSAVNFAARVMQNTFVASRVELKGWEAWRNIRGYGITLSEAKQLISDTTARIKPDDLNKFEGAPPPSSQRTPLTFFGGRVTKMGRGRRERGGGRSKEEHTRIGLREKRRSSTTGQTETLSIGESEYCVVSVTTTAEALHLRICSTTARGIIQRQECGPLKHIGTILLWLQAKHQKKKLVVVKEPTQTNAADGFTKALQTAKHLEWRNGLRHL